MQILYLNESKILFGLFNKRKHLCEFRLILKFFSCGSREFNKPKNDFSVNKLHKFNEERQYGHVYISSVNVLPIMYINKHFWCSTWRQHVKFVTSDSANVSKQIKQSE